MLSHATAEQSLENMLTWASRSASPFWRSASSNSQRDTAGSGKVFGASYSHADILKFDSLYATCRIKPDLQCLTQI